MMQWRINFWENGDVVTDDGEVIGTWQRDAEDHPSFTPAGASRALIWSIGLPSLAQQIETWLDNEDGASVS